MELIWKRARLVASPVIDSRDGCINVSRTFHVNKHFSRKSVVDSRQCLLEHSVYNCLLGSGLGNSKSAGRTKKIDGSSRMAPASRNLKIQACRVQNRPRDTFYYEKACLDTDLQPQVMPG